MRLGDDGEDHQQLDQREARAKRFMNTALDEKYGRGRRAVSCFRMVNEGEPEGKWAEARPT